MPRISYAAAQVVKPALSATGVECRGVHYRFPEGQPHTVTYYFEAVDAEGNVISREPVTLPLAAQEVDRLQREAFREADRVYPAGPVA